MGWFQLDPENVARRVEAAGNAPGVPALAASVWRGALGFTLVSVLGFAPWAFGGGWFYRRLGEAGLYAVCALVFIAAAGPLMHRLIIGPGALSRFYKLFGASFAAYAVAWTAAWMLLGGHLGSLVGLFAGTALMGWMLARAFDARGETVKVIAALFLLNAAGYFAGGELYAWLGGMEGLPLADGTRIVIARSSWAVAYGIGFGAGLGVAFHQCQAATRARLARTQDAPGPAGG